MPVGIWCQPHVGSTVIVVIIREFCKDSRTCVWFLISCTFNLKFLVVSLITIVSSSDGNVIRVLTIKIKLIVDTLGSVKTIDILCKVAVCQVFGRNCSDFSRSRSVATILVETEEAQIVTCIQRNIIFVRAIEFQNSISFIVIVGDVDCGNSVRNRRVFR